jgi:hypothetical protein
MDSLHVAPDDRLLAPSAGPGHYTGRPGIVTLTTRSNVEQVARAYDTRWLVLNARRHRPRAGTDPGRRGRPP